MKVGDLVRCKIESDYGIITEGQENNDGWYRIQYVDGTDDYVTANDVEVISENR